MADQQTNSKALDKVEPDFLSAIIDELPVDRLKEELQDALTAVAERAIEAAGDKVSDLTSRLTDVADGGSLFGGGVKGSMVAGALKGGLSGVKDKAKEALTGGGGSGSKPAKATKATNIVEQIDIGVPIDVVYNQWTEFQDFPSFMKKVESVEQQSEEKLTWKAKIVWSHRSWEATILDQVPDDRIVWRSKGQKGHVDGAVTFHELAPNLTRILVVLEYYPQGMFERVGNIWRAQGRRARVELKHFRRHVMTRTILRPDEVEGWRGEIHDSQVTRGPDEDEYDEDEYDESTEAEDDVPEDEGDEDEYDDSDEYDDEDEEAEDDADEEPEDEYDEGAEDDEDEGAEDEGAEDEDLADDADYDEEPEDEYDEEPEDEYDEEPEDEYDDEDEDVYDDEDEEDDRPSRRRAS